jgi:hypothetical protein
VPITASFLFRGEERHLLQATASTLRHLAGVTAMRLDFGAPTKLWTNAAGERDAGKQPDGLWAEPRAEGVFRAIEYDSGSYGHAELVAKMKQFNDAYGMQFWGVASEARVETVERVLRELGCLGTVDYVPWWE